MMNELKIMDVLGLYKGNFFVRIVAQVWESGNLLRAEEMFHGQVKNYWKSSDSRKIDLLEHAEFQLTETYYDDYEEEYVFILTKEN